MSYDYGKVQTFFLRDPETKFKTVLEGQYALPEFEQLAFIDWDFTEKVDGTNVRVSVTYKRDITIGGHHANSQIPTPLLNYLMQAFTPDTLGNAIDFSKLEQDESVLTLYGEGYGAGIQNGGGNYRQDQGFILFDVCVGGVWLQRPAVETIASALRVPVVPLLAVGTMWEAVAMVKQGFPSQCSYESQVAEGLVCRPHIELLNRMGHRIITKLKFADWQRNEHG